MAWLGGRAVRQHEQLAASLALRNAELAEEQEAHAELSVRYERARIAGELHDLVAHAISVMVIQAGAGQRLAGTDPQRSREAFQAIAGAAREAESDLPGGSLRCSATGSRRRARPTSRSSRS